MNRRTFVLGGGAVGLASLGATATAASLGESVSVSGEFRVIEEAAVTEMAVDAAPNNERAVSTHTWAFPYVPFDGEIADIVFEYPPETEFDGVSSDDVTVELTLEGDEEPTEIGIQNDDYSGSRATVALNRNEETTVDGEATVTIDGIVNPAEGEYAPTVTLEGDDTASTDATLTIEGDAPYFDVEIVDAPDTVEPGDSLAVDYEVTNAGTVAGEQDVVVTVDGTVEADERLELEPGSTEVLTHQTTTDETQSTVEVTVESDDATDSVSVSVTAEWTIDVDPAHPNETATHTASTPMVGFEGHLTSISLSYPDGAELDAVSESDVTVEMELADQGLTTMEVATVDASETHLEVGLEDGEEPAGELELEVENVENESRDTYDAEISLSGPDDSLTAESSFEI